MLSREYEARLEAGKWGLPAEAGGGHTGALAELQRRAIEAQRERLLDLRARSVIGDDAFHALEEEIDLLERTADAQMRPATDALASG